MIAGLLGLTIAASISIRPDYLSYFNWVSGGPDRIPARLIDSNLDWGQDLVALQRWWRKTIPDEKLGLAYFGQINPSIFAVRGESFRWFLPPAWPGTIQPMVANPSPMLIGPAPELTPGYYAVSATVLYGLPWRFYDPAPPDSVPEAWAMAWNAYRFNAFGYFRRFTPIERIGHSIYVYRLSAEDVARVNDSVPSGGRWKAPLAERRQRVSRDDGNPGHARIDPVHVLDGAIDGPGQETLRNPRETRLRMRSSV